MERTWYAEHATCPFYHSHLEAQTYTKERDFLFSCPFYGENHTLRAALPEPTWNQNTPVSI